jgi:hypothetical protein
VGAGLLFDLDLAEAGAMSVYISGDDVEQAQGALRHGTKLQVIAARLLVPESALRAALGLDRMRVVPVDQGELDLWAGCDRLESLL